MFTSSTKLVLFLVLGSLFSALQLVDGNGRRIMLSPNEMKRRLMKAFTEHHLGDDMDRAARELATTHDGYDTVCEDFGYTDLDGIDMFDTLNFTTDSSSSVQWECFCDCDGWKLDFGNWTNMACAYESFTEAITACYGSDALEDCEDACSTVNGDGIWGYYDCFWSLYHKTLYAYGWCNDTLTTNSWWTFGPSSMDTTDSSGCFYYATGSDDGNYFGYSDDLCDWFDWFYDSSDDDTTSDDDALDSAAPSSGRKLIAAMVVANGLLVVGIFLATILL